jgi:hypothetical protein
VSADSESGSGDSARHFIALACALNRNVSANDTDAAVVLVDVDVDDDRSEIVAVMPCRTRSYEPAIIWMTGADIGSDVLTSI